MVSNLFSQVFTCFEVMWEVAENLRVWWFRVILFLVIIWIMLLLFVMMFVVVVLVMIVVTFLCQESAWLCGVCV